MASSPATTHFPASPSRDAPNSHPYAIKTSSSAVLTRSNSSGNRSSITHHYTPISPTKNTLATKQSRYVPTHRHTRSLSSEDVFAKPPPVPMPPSSSVLVGLANQQFGRGEDMTVSDGDGIPPTPPMTWRLRRSETLPSVFPSKSDSELSTQDLPKNPKVWTPSQLSVYLSSALRLKGDVKLPAPVTRDIASFVVKEHLSGRAFLRMKKEDYDHLGINQLWKDTLLDASRSLRQNIVQGRIIGFGPGSPLSPRSTEETLEEEEDVPADLPAYNPLNTSRRRVPLQWEEDQKRMGKTLFRAGRVRGMVETYQRSVSGSSASGSDCDDDEDKGAEFEKPSAVQMTEEPVGDETGFASGEQSSASDDEAARHANGIGGFVPQGEDPSAFNQNVTVNGTDDDAPSIEVLLREQEQNDPQGNKYSSWGAKAWEDEVENPDGVHVTARRLPQLTHGTAQRTPAEWQNTMAHLSTAENARKSLADIFEQPVREVSPIPKTTQDVGVGVEEKPDDDGTPDSKFYELLEMFRQRLEVVEKRLDELEHKEAEREAGANGMNVAGSKAQLDPEPDPRVVKMRRHFPRAIDMAYPSETRRVRNYTEADPSVSGLPRYMFLISLGVVAVVTRVVLRRLIGGRKKK